MKRRNIIILLALLISMAGAKAANEPLIMDVSQVSAGGGHTMILKTDGSLWACGRNDCGQLGDGTATDYSTPKQVMTGVAAVSAGADYTMILKTDGSLWACGYNGQGQLGDGTTTKRRTPKQVMTGVAAVSAGYGHTMILKTDGSLWACGLNGNGQLGDGTTTSCSTPKQVMTGVSAVSAGGSHTMILKTDGTLWACGRNLYGQLGDDTTTDCSTPKQVMTGVAKVSAGNSHTMILKTDGSLWACGYNYNGQLGDGTTTNRSTPKQVMTGVAAVSAGYGHTMILKADGSLWTCGRNNYGQLGDGTTTDCGTPKQVMTGVASVSAGSSHTMIVKTDGSLWACGYNGYGQLGDGTTTNCSTPVQIAQSGNGGVNPTDINITFADANVKALCVANWDTSGDGELSEAEAAAVTDLGSVFKQNTTITSFDELQYFTSLTAIGNSAFQGCSGLTNISIPISVTSIGTFAFSGCSVLTMVNIPNQETSIGGKAFYGTAWFNNQPDGLVYIGKVAYSYKGTMPPNTEIVLKEGTTEIATGAFESCTGLKSIYLPNSLKHIGYEVFYGCSGLTNISIPNTVASIGGDAFHGCTSLSSVNIPDGLTQIEYNTFYGCSSLSSVVIPRSVTSIGDYAFYGCSGLTSVTVKWETPLSISYYTFYVFYGSHTNNATLYVPKGTKAVYEADYYWKKFKEIVEMEEEIVSTDISQLDNVIYIEPTEERTGTETTISFKMKNTAAIRGFQFDLELPEGVTPMEEDGEYVYWLNADRAPKKAGGQYYHTLEVTKQADGTYRFLCGAQQNKTFSGNDGEVAVIKVNIADNMKEGDYPIVLRNIKLTETDISNYYQTDEVVTKLTVVTYIPGDISGDGIVDVSDYIGVANHILGNTPTGFNARAADVNNDNVIDVSDYIGIANIILTGSIYGNNNAARLMDKEGEQNPQ